MIGSWKRDIISANNAHLVVNTLKYHCRYAIGWDTQTLNERINGSVRDFDLKFKK